MKKVNISILIFFLFVSIKGIARESDSSNFQTFKIGDIDITILSDGYGRTMPIQPTIAPTTPPSTLKKFLQSNNLSEEYVENSVNIMLLKKGDRLVLIDTGAGSTMGPTLGKLISNLESVGIKPEEITDILITHAHGDHIGGLIDTKGESAFKNAVIYMSQDEFDFWMLNKYDFSKTKIPEALYGVMSQAVEGQKKILEIIHPQLTFLQDGDTILDCIQIKLAPGHTGGHIVSTIFSNEESLVHIADLVMSDPIDFAHLEWGNMLDADFDQAVETRKNTLRQLCENSNLAFAYHLPYPGIGHVEKSTIQNYRWKPYILPDKSK